MSNYRTPAELTCLYQNNSVSQAVQKALREMQSNAANYEATNSHVFLGRTRVEDKDWDMLWFHHNGKPWKVEDIYNVIPGHSGKKGGAFQGMGLASAAFLCCSMVDQPILALGGWIDNKFDMYKLWGGLTNMDWQHEHAPDLAKEYTRLVGEVLLSKKDREGRREFGVVYGIKVSGIDIENGKPKTPFSLKQMSSLPFYSPSLFGEEDDKSGRPVFRYSQYGIGYPDSKASLTLAGGNKGPHGDSSSYFRKLYNYERYMQQACAKTFTLPVEADFEIEENLYATLQAEVKISFFQNLKSKSSSSYYATIRDSEHSSRGNQNEGVTPPNVKAYLKFPCLFEYAKLSYSQNESNAWKRFEDNALMTHSQIFSLAEFLDLRSPQSTKHDAMDLSKFDSTLIPVDKNEYNQEGSIVLDISVKQITKFKNIKTGEDVTTRNNAFTFVNALGRTADFWVRDNTKAHELMKTILKSAASCVPAEAKELHATLFPQEYRNRPKITIGCGKELELNKKGDLNRDAKVDVYCLDEETLKTEKLNMEPNSRKTVVIKNVKTGHLYKASEFDFIMRKGCKIMKGIEFVDTTENSAAWGDPDAAENVKVNLNELADLLGTTIKNLPVITFTAEPIKYKGKRIKVEEYKSGQSGYTPSRNIRLMTRFS